MYHVSVVPARPDKTVEPHMMTMRGFTEGDTGTTDWFATGQEDVRQAIKVCAIFNIFRSFLFFLLSLMIGFFFVKIQCGRGLF